jgi:hypothetical protein
MSEQSGPRQWRLIGQYVKVHTGDNEWIEAHRCTAIAPQLKIGEGVDVVELSAFESLQAELAALQAKAEKLVEHLKRIEKFGQRVGCKTTEQNWAFYGKQSTQIASEALKDYQS